MKGISSQLDSLVDVLKKNIINKELLHSRENFQIVYEKITQEAFKTINVMIENFTDDFPLKLSYSTLLKQLKTFLSLKPETNDDSQQEYFSQEYDQVKQFMNSRKPVMQETDAGQRGDIYKFLYQAQNKQKDIAEFMGNVDKFNVKANKRFQQTNHKWRKKTLKSIAITESIQTQTDLNLTVFNSLQKSFPNIFCVSQASQQSDNMNRSLKQGEIPINIMTDIEAKIQQMVNHRIEQKAAKLAIEQKKVKQVKQKQQKQQKQLKDKEMQQKLKKETQKKKKPNKPNQNNKTNMKRNSLQVGNTAALKGKSQFSNSYKKKTIISENDQKPQALQIINQVSHFDSEVKIIVKQSEFGNNKEDTNSNRNIVVMNRVNIDNESKTKTQGNQQLQSGIQLQQQSQSYTQSYAQSQSNIQLQSTQQIKAVVHNSSNNNNNSNKNNNNINTNNNSNDKRTQQLLPNLQSFLSQVTESNQLQGVSHQQIKTIYQLFKSQLQQNIIKNDHTHLNAMQSTIISEKITNDFNMKNSNQQNGNVSYAHLNTNNITTKIIQTEQKSVNTETSYWNNNQHQHDENCLTKRNNSRSKFFSKGPYNYYQKQINEINRLSSTSSLTKSKKQDYPSSSLQKNNMNSKFTPYINSQQHRKDQTYKQFDSQLTQNQFQNHQSSINEKKGHLIQVKNTFPQLCKASDSDKLHSIKKSDSADLLAKEGKTADEYLKRLRDTKQLSSLQNTKAFNKQNYTLDMYKSKDTMCKNRTFDHINLPSLISRNPDKPNTSLHEQVDEPAKSPYMKKLEKVGKKRTANHSSMESIVYTQKEQQSENDRTIIKKERKVKEDVKQEERIMNELTKISNEGSVKLNLRSIARFINSVESIHLKRCGQKCIHLERFYSFLTRHNIPNRKEYYMHKADMNSNVKEI